MTVGKQEQRDADQRRGRGRWDAASNAEARGETRAQQLDRNYGELLQELRVVQTGVQILFAFLLSLVFQQRFTVLSVPQRYVYFVTLLFAVGASALLIAPVAHHRLLFRQRAKDEVVETANRLAIVGLGFVALSLTGSVYLIADVLFARELALGVGAVSLLVFAGLWFALPRTMRNASGRPGGS